MMGGRVNRVVFHSGDDIATRLFEAKAEPASS